MGTMAKHQFERRINTRKVRRIPRNGVKTYFCNNCMEFIKPFELVEGQCKFCKENPSIMTDNLTVLDGDFSYTPYTIGTKEERDFIQYELFNRIYEYNGLTSLESILNHTTDKQNLIHVAHANSKAILFNLVLMECMEWIRIVNVPSDLVVHFVNHAKDYIIGLNSNDLSLCIRDIKGFVSLAYSEELKLYLNK